MTMVLKTESRPAPLPPRPTLAGGGRVPSPDGAVGWAKVWLDATGLPQTTSFPVPVDADGRRTLHVRYICRGRIEVAGEVLPCDHVAWLSPGAPSRFCPDHGAALDPEQVGESGGVPWAAVWDVLDERIRVAAAGIAVGATGVAADQAEDMAWWLDLAQVASLPAVVASSWWLTRWWLTRRDVKRGRIDPGDEVAGKRRRRLIAKRARVAAYAAAGAGVWVQGADLGDFTAAPGSLGMWLLGLAGTAVVCSQPYRAYVDAERKTRPVEVPAAEETPAAVEGEPPGVIAARKWTEHDPAGTVPNTVLVADSWRKVVGGWGIIIRALKPGAVAIDMLTDQSSKGRLRAIAGTFGLHRKYFNFVEQDDPNDVLMLVQPNPPLVEGKVWLGPESIDVEKGVAHTGFFIDGSDVFEPFYRYGWGAPSKVVLGTTGSGKSVNLRKQIIIERYFAHTNPETGEKKGLFATFLHDFKQFQSYGEFRRAIHAAGSTVDDAYIMRDALIREMHRRYAMLSSYVWEDKKGRRREGGIEWDPRIHGPVLSWIIDEFHEIAKDKDFIGPLELLARKMRACGIRITIGTHMGTLGDTGSRGLRDMLAGGYALLGRTTDALTSVVTGGQLTADPRQLPKLPGMCLVADGEQQTMHARQTYIPADEDAPLNVYDLLFDDANNPIGYPAVLPLETLEAFGPDWVAWAEAGKQPGGRPEGQWMPKDAATPGQTPGPDGDAGSARDAVASILMSDGGPMDIDAIDKALAPFRARGVKCSTRTARDALKTLVEEKFAFKPTGHGLYQVVPHVQEDLLDQLAETADGQE